MSLKDSLSPDQLISYLQNNVSIKKIAKEYSVSRQRIYQLLEEYKEKYPEKFKGICKKLPTKEELEQLIKENKSYSYMAEKYSISIKYLKMLMENHELEKKFIKEQLTKKKLKELYVQEEKSDSEIAEIYNCSKNTVMRMRYLNDVKQIQRNRKLSKEIFIDLYKNKNLLLEQIANLFDKNIQTIIKLRKQYNIPRKRALGVTEEELEKIRQDLKKKGVI